VPDQPVQPAFAQLTRRFVRFVAIGWKHGSSVPILDTIDS
jgi:hypothetical protein